MEKSKKTAPMIAHVALLALLCILSIVSAVIIFTGNIPSGFEASEDLRELLQCVFHNHCKL